jgi:purine-binding chemotaxis protein CheW
MSVEQQVPENSKSASSALAACNEEVVTFTVCDQSFGIPVLKVQDILSPERIAPIPLAASAIAGSINLRGRIVTVIDMKERLGMVRPATGGSQLGVTVGHDEDLYTLLVDNVGDVVSLPADRREDTIRNMDPAWRDVVSATYRLEDGLLIVLDVEGLLDFNH